MNKATSKVQKPMDSLSLPNSEGYVFNSVVLFSLFTKWLSVIIYCCEEYRIFAVVLPHRSRPVIYVSIICITIGRNELTLRWPVILFVNCHISAWRCILRECQLCVLHLNKLMPGDVWQTGSSVDHKNDIFIIPPHHRSWKGGICSDRSATVPNLDSVRRAGLGHGRPKTGLDARPLF